MAALPDFFRDVAHLEEFMTTPSPVLRVEFGALAGDLDSRVRSLEVAVARLESERGQPAAPAVHVHAHPSLQLVNVPSGTERCIMEPDRPCVKSGACRTFGH